MRTLVRRLLNAVRWLAVYEEALVECPGAPIALSVGRDLIRTAGFAPDIEGSGLQESSDDPRARLAIQMFCYRARKYLGAYLAALGGAEAVVFTGGIGEHSPEVRAEICSGMEWCGLAIDPERNQGAVGRQAVIGAVGARMGAFVILSDEEVVIARDTVACLEGRG